MYIFYMVEKMKKKKRRFMFHHVFPTKKGIKRPCFGAIGTHTEGFEGVAYGHEDCVFPPQYGELDHFVASKKPSEIQDL